MITNFKIFENLNQGEVEIGDYILINHKTGIFNPSYFDNIAKVINIIEFEIFPVYVIFEKLLTDPDDMSGMGYSDSIKFSAIEYWSKNREDLEYIIKSKKFNI